MKNAALRQLHEQPQPRPDEAGSDETDGHGDQPSERHDEQLQPLEERSSSSVDGNQYAEISSSRAATSGSLPATTSDDGLLPVQQGFPKSLRRNKIFKKRQNLRQKLKSNLLQQTVQIGPPEALPVAAEFSNAANNQREEHPCSICGKTFATASLLRKHARFHIQRSVIPCAHCPALFEKQWQYESHLASAHGQVGQHACPDCEQVFSLRSQLLGHMQTSHKKVSVLFNYNQFLKHRVNFAETFGTGTYRYLFFICFV
jgi:uncharacterized C2H2 Zn-finger protein